MYLVVGAGLAGAVMAERIASVLGEEVTVVESRDHVGGNIYDYADTGGILAHKYGPHAFHTNDREVWDHLSRFTEWEPYFHKVEACIDGQAAPLPFNFNSIERLFPRVYADKLIDSLLSEYAFGRKVTIMELLQNGRFKFLAEYIYEKVFLGYSLKQWGKSPDELDISVAGRVPVMMGRDDRYFQDTYQAIPRHGYTRLIENLLSSPKIEVQLGRPFKAEDLARNYEKIIYTGQIDRYFDYVHGPLPYRSLRFEMRCYGREFYQKTAQKNFPENFDFTRITEFKHFLRQKSPSTVIALEYPQDYLPGENEAYYPVKTPDSDALYHKYRVMAASEKRVVFLGRLAEYKYCNMDEAVRSALDAFEGVRHA